MEPTVTPAEYAALRAAVDWPVCPPAEAEAALQRSLAVAIARNADGRLVGLARAVGDGFYVVVVDVIVDPREQDQGIAHRLLTDLLATQPVRAAGHLTLFAAPEAVGLYEELGFREEKGVYMVRPTPDA
ncbi:GNAT family N-acetyltransferase [Nocardioides jiangxiensis]|uniref:GNAT family N-acetyltransferase n=1 Tax=Nocardioides jiangxiensis TaxID=3064524 RepID=A0ABT9B052_9ACTN|nr:GNAT family N-acetyltransferase [Nocardioides sp. WY-20]MDO7866987.1 GNAT family N-acetyltransferase [Nocardioides sp. WY-20]